MLPAHHRKAAAATLSTASTFDWRLTFDAFPDEPALQDGRQEEAYEEAYDASFIGRCVGTAAGLLYSREPDDKEDEPDCVKKCCWQREYGHIVCRKRPAPAEHIECRHGLPLDAGVSARSFVYM